MHSEDDRMNGGFKKSFVELDKPKVRLWREPNGQVYVIEIRSEQFNAFIDVWWNTYLEELDAHGVK